MRKKILKLGVRAQIDASLDVNSENYILINPMAVLYLVGGGSSVSGKFDAGAACNSTFSSACEPSPASQYCQIRAL